MPFHPLELLCVLALQLRQGNRSLSSRLLQVMESAEGAEIAEAVIVSWDDMVNVGSDLRAPDASLVHHGASMTIALQGLTSEVVPVRREA